MTGHEVRPTIRSSAEIISDGPEQPHLVRLGPDRVHWKPARDSMVGGSQRCRWIRLLFLYDGVFFFLPLPSTRLADSRCPCFV